jgi:hypothetical protein
MSKSDGVSLHKIPKPTHGEIVNGARPFVAPHHSVADRQLPWVIPWE